MITSNKGGGLCMKSNLSFLCWELKNITILFSLPIFPVEKALKSWAGDSTLIFFTFDLFQDNWPHLIPFDPIWSHLIPFYLIWSNLFFGFFRTIDLPTKYDQNFFCVQRWLKQSKPNQPTDRNTISLFDFSLCLSLKLSFFDDLWLSLKLAQFHPRLASYFFFFDF